MSDEPAPHPTEPKMGEILFYSGPDGTTRLEVFFEDESFWLTQRRMADLFDVATINHHLKEIFASGELVEDRTIRKFRTAQTEGARQVAREIEYYNLDTIIAVGYRVIQDRSYENDFEREAKKQLGKAGPTRQNKPKDKDK
jgi:hypothetical protein